MGSHEGRCADWDALGNSQVLSKLKHMCAFEFKESAHGFPFIFMFASAKQICDDYDSCLNCKQKAPLHLNLFGEYFQSIRILFKHCGHNRKNTNKEDCRVKSESEQIEQDCRAESESGQNFGPLSTTPPSPRAPPAGLLPPLQLPGPGDCKAGYLLPGKEQKPVNILPSATSWLQLE